MYHIAISRKSTPTLTPAPTPAAEPNFGKRQQVETYCELGDYCPYTDGLPANTVRLARQKQGQAPDTEFGSFGLADIFKQGLSRSSGNRGPSAPAGASDVRFGRQLNVLA